MKRWIIVGSIVLTVVALLVLRIVHLARSEEYSITKHAIASMFPSTGIDITGWVDVEFPECSRIDEVSVGHTINQFDEAELTYTDKGARIRMGYGGGVITIACRDSEGKKWIVILDVHKQNNWSQISVRGTGPRMTYPLFVVTHNDDEGQAGVGITVTPSD